jgi:hypothetical protein
VRIPGVAEQKTSIAMKRILGILEKTAKVLLVAAVLLWICDWVVYRLRAARGTAFDSVQVEEYLSTALKGNKQEYDYMGTAEMSCARAIFPHGGAPACWWLRRHTTQWE